MCNNFDSGSCDNCIADILKAINVLQQNVCRKDNCLETCDRNTLGGQRCGDECNTRPVILYPKDNDGRPCAMPIFKTSDPNAPTSIVFRVEKVDNCCITFRVLEEKDGEKCRTKFMATESFFTVDANSLCAIRCLDDTFVECV